MEGEYFYGKSIQLYNKMKSTVSKDQKINLFVVCVVI